MNILVNKTFKNVISSIIAIVTMCSIVATMWVVFFKTTLSNENTEVNKYKAKVIAMKLLDSYLDEYIYNGDSKVISITFNSINDDKTKNSLIQYLIDLAGYNNREDEKINTMENNRKTRIAEYINTAISNGTLNKNDILKM